MKHLRFIAVALAVALSVSGCATQLAPAYDQVIAGELVTANSDIQALFVSVGTKATAATYAARQPAYDHIVAELQATELQIKSRPIPNPDALQSANKVLAKLNFPALAVDPNFSQYPSARSVDDLAATIQHMQAADQGAGLAGMEINAFKNQSNIFLIQAITYENFLKR